MLDINRDAEKLHINVENELISVVVPAFNCERTLERCVTSILNQDNDTGFDLEIILVDDGSTDTTLDICHELAESDSRVIIIHKKNGGVSSARNAGIEAASGKWIFFADSDDELCSYALDKLFRAGERTKADLVSAGYYRISGNHSHRRVPRKNRSISRDRAIISLLLEREIDPNVWTKLFIRDNCKSILFDENMSIGEDRDFIYRYLLLSQKVTVIRESIYCYRITENSAMRSGFSKKYLDSVRFSERVAEEFGEDHPEYTDILQAQILRTKCRTLRAMLEEDFLDNHEEVLLRTLVSQVKSLLQLKILIQLPIRHIYMCIYTRYFLYPKWLAKHNVSVSGNH